jgi:hypothetical protein
MPFVRVADFEADEEAIDKFVAMVKADPTPPNGVPATGINVLANRAESRMRVVVFFDSEEALEAGNAILDTMNPPDDLTLRRLNVEMFEVLVQQLTP